MALIYCSNCGARISDKAEACPKCGTRLQVTPTAVQPQAAPTQVQPLGEEVPTRMYGWNWGAFTYPLIWAYFNGVYWPLWFLLAPFLIVLSCGISFGFGIFLGALFSLAVFIVAIILGSKGCEMAWEKNEDNVDAKTFDRIQHNWNKAGIIFWFFPIMGFVFLWFSTIFGYSMLLNKLGL